MSLRTCAALAAALLALSSCRAEDRDTFGPATRLHRENVLYFGGGAEPESIDPGVAYDSPGLEIARNLFEGLLRYHPETLKPLPGVAHAWERSEDGKRYVFHLRKDARWSDGKAVTAHDFVFSWRRVLDPATAAQYSALFWDIRGAKAFAEGKGAAEDVGLRALDDHTFEVVLERPVPWFLDLLPFAPFHPVPRWAVEAHGIRWTRPEHIVSNGPFVLEKWVIAYEIRLKKSPTYWGRDEVRLDGAVAIVSDDDHAMLRLFRAGELDWMGADAKPPQEYFGVLAGKRDYHTNPELASYFYWVNLRTDTEAQRRSPLQDVRVRRALNMALDKDSLARFVLRGGERPARNIVPDLFERFGYVGPEGDPHDPDGARRLLAEAGYGPGGKPFPPFEIAYNTNERHKQVAEAIQQMWKKELGIEVELANYEWKVFMNNRTEGFYQVARAGWTGDFQEPYTFLSMFLSDAELNEARWKNDEYDRLIHAAVDAQDEAARFQLYRQAEEILNRELPAIPIYFYAKQTLRAGWVKGFWPNSQDVHPFRDIWIEGVSEGPGR